MNIRVLIFHTFFKEDETYRPSYVGKTNALTSLCFGKLFLLKCQGIKKEAMAPFSANFSLPVGERPGGTADATFD